MENSMEIPQKLGINYHMTQQSHNWVYILRYGFIIEKDTCTPMFTTALFTIARTWKQPRCPSTDEWIQGLLYIHTIFSSVQSLSHVRLFATPWTAAHQASLSITNSRSLPKLMSIELVMPSSYLILCRPLHLLPSIPPSIKVFSSESTLRMRWPKYCSFSFSIIPSKEIPGLISFRMDWLDLLAGHLDLFVAFLSV